MESKTKIKVFIKPLNSCVQRRQNIEKWHEYININAKFELIDKIEDSDEIWIWTCAFREDVKENSLMYLLKKRKQYTSSLLYI